LRYGVPPMDTLSVSGRRVRLAATLLVAGVLLAGTLWGQDDAFPFGPFRMYATTDRPDAPVRDTRLQGVDTAGNRITLTESDTGIRRAEIEGQLDQIRADPGRLGAVAAAYAGRHPRAPRLVEVSVVVRWHELSGGRPTGHFHDQTLATWRTS
jgi:hypothetical protein